MTNPFPFDLAAIDLDGTLLGPDSRVGERNRAAVDLLREAGVCVVLASGRMHAATKPTHDELGLDTPIVSYNGSMVKDTVTGEVLLHHTLDVDSSRKIVDWAECERRHINFYMDDTLYVSETTEWSDLYNLRTGSVIVPVGSLHNFDGMSPTKIIFVGQPHETLEQQDRWRAEFDGSVYIVRTCSEYLEFLNPVANKWEGIKVVADRYGIAYDRIAAFGDSPNDLPMLKHAVVSVVMPHADPEALAEAGYVPEGAPDEAFAVAVEDMAVGRWP